MRQRASYKRKYKGLIRKTLAKSNAIKYPTLKVGDVVRAADNLLEIDTRILGYTDGYSGEQVRRRNRYRYLVKNSTRGVIVDIRVSDIYVKWRVKKEYPRLKLGFDKPLLMRKQMLKKLKKKTP